MTAFSLVGGAGLVAGTNVPSAAGPGPCAHPLSYSHAIDLLLAKEDEAERDIMRIRAELRSRQAEHDASRLRERLDWALEAKDGVRLAEAVARWEAIRDCVSLLLRHQRRHDPADVTEMIVIGGSQLELDARRAGWESFIAMTVQESE